MNNLLPISDTSSQVASTWRPLELFNLYRLSLALILGFLVFHGGENALIGAAQPKLALATTSAYFLFSLVSMISIRLRQPGFHLQAYLQVAVDILFITLLMYLSGGIESGLGMLIIIVIAGAAIIVPGRIAHLFAAIATLSVLVAQVFAYLEGVAAASYPQAGMLGASYFATATMAYVLAKRIRASEALAQQRGIDLEDMASLNEHIISELDAGVIVIDQHTHVRQMNATAEKMLGQAVIDKRTQLSALSFELLQSYRQWLHDDKLHGETIELGTSAIRARPRFIQLGSNNRHYGTLIFLQDISSLMQQAQQMKLASLGQLTASIAHEIRNPLGAISHAGQLLQESLSSEDDQRLTEIIRNHSDRVNTIIENILQLSRREQFLPEEVSLGPWLRHFTKEFCQDKNLPAEDIRVTMSDEETPILFDASQLHQILTNLTENALRYSVKEDSSPRLEFHSRHNPESGGPILDIIDNGPGIAADKIQHIFEPFYTTESSGTGLGLYICRELCEINQARIAYSVTPEGKSCFRIYFMNQPDL